MKEYSNVSWSFLASDEPSEVANNETSRWDLSSQEEEEVAS